MLVCTQHCTTVRWQIRASSLFLHLSGTLQLFLEYYLHQLSFGGVVWLCMQYIIALLLSVVPGMCHSHSCVWPVHASHFSVLLMHKIGTDLGPAHLKISPKLHQLSLQCKHCSQHKPFQLKQHGSPSFACMTQDVLEHFKIFIFLWCGPPDAEWMHKPMSDRVLKAQLFWNLT